MTVRVQFVDFMKTPLLIVEMPVVPRVGETVTLQLMKRGVRVHEVEYIVRPIQTHVIVTLTGRQEDYYE